MRLRGLLVSGVGRLYLRRECVLRLVRWLVWERGWGLGRLLGMGLFGGVP